MATQSGSNLSDVKARNRNLILKLIATQEQVSRADLSRMTGLTKTTLGNIVADLMAQNIICEQPDYSPDAVAAVGRRPILLDISPFSPCIMGMLIKRGLCTAILSDLKGHILDQINYEYQGNLSAQKLIDILMMLYSQLSPRHQRPIAAIGIASIGPVDTIAQKIVNPPNFFGIHNLPIAGIIHSRTGLPTFLINDSNAGALAEKLYGKAKSLSNFIYLHIMNGIGAGYILDGKIYNGDIGQSGEVGHTSINFSGPICDCGNAGCLELYANIDNMNRKIRSLRNVYPKTTLLPAGKESFTWREIVDAAAKMDYFATAALEDFCEYVSYAMVNVVNLLDIEHIILGYDAAPSTKILEKILQDKLNTKALSAKYRKIVVEKSAFGGDAPLIGAIALVADMIFAGKFSLASMQ